MLIEEKDIIEEPRVKTVSFERVEHPTTLFKRVAQDFEVFMMAKKNEKIYNALPPGIERDKWLTMKNGHKTGVQFFNLSSQQVYIDIPEDVHVSCMIPMEHEKDTESLMDMLRAKCETEEPNPFERWKKLYDFTQGEEGFPVSVKLFGKCFNSPEPKSTPVFLNYLVDDHENVIGITSDHYNSFPIEEGGLVRIAVFETHNKADPSWETKNDLWEYMSELQDQDGCGGMAMWTVGQFIIVSFHEDSQQ